MVTGREGTNVVSRNANAIKRMFTSILPAMRINETDDFQSKFYSSDEEKHGRIPVRYRNKLRDPENICTNLLYSAAQYYESAARYEKITEDNALFEAMYDVLE